MNSQQQIFNEVKRYNFPTALANLIAAQAAHETGNFTSAIFLDCNNAFGYKSVTSATNCNLHPTYKAYSTVEQSADEIVNWIQRRQSEGNFPSDLSTIQTPEDYAYYLKYNGYFEDTAANYAAGITNYLSNFSPSANMALYVAGFGVLILLLRKKRTN